jgi:hypothetical protein
MTIFSVPKYNLSNVQFDGAPQACLWSLKTKPTYAPRRCSAFLLKRQGFGGSSAGERNPPKHDRLIAKTVYCTSTHSSTAKAVVSCVGG